MRLEGLEQRRLTVEGLGLDFDVGGAGPPLLLLHGYPQTRLAWHRLAPLLAGRFRLVVPDLPGYGASEGPPADGGAAAYGKRNLARLMVALMQALGHPRFHVCGHDRGARIAYRMALDSPERVDRLVLLDIVPTGVAWERMRAEAAHRGFHWLFLAQPAPLPERVVAADPEAFVGGLLDRWAGGPEALDPQARAAYVSQFRNPAVVEAACEDYRAGYRVDRQLDDADRAAGRRIGAPTLVLWGRRYLADPEPVWRDWCDDLTVEALDCGHFLAEEEPDAVAAATARFLA